MEQQIQTYVTTPKLQSLLAWAEQITDTSQTDIKLVAKRAIALSFAKVNANAKAFLCAKVDANALFRTFGPSSSLSKVNTEAYTKALVKAEALSKALTINNSNANAIASALATAEPYAKALASIKVYGKSLARAIENAYAKAYEKAIEAPKAIDATNAIETYANVIEKLIVYKKIDFNELLVKLKNLQDEISDKKQDFINKIIQTVLEGFQLNTEMIDLSVEEFESLENYFYANKLMLDCKEAAVRVSQKTWNAIEEQMFLPTNRAS